MDSKIEMNEMVENKERKFGSNLEYYPAYIYDASGEKHEALFTADQLETAMERAGRNPEDMPAKSFWDFLFG